MKSVITMMPTNFLAALSHKGATWVSREGGREGRERGREDE